MSKVFIQNGTGSTATLENAHNEKIPIYDTLQDAEADLANIEENQIVATQDNGNNNRFVTQSEYKADNTYSTTETDTGKTWVDGKKIYRKVINVGNLPASTTKTLSTGITNADSLTFLGGTAKGSTTSAPLPYPSIDNNNEVQVWISNDFSNLYIRTNLNSWSSSVGWVVVEYTKQS